MDRSIIVRFSTGNHCWKVLNPHFNPQLSGAVISDIKICEILTVVWSFMLTLISMIRMYENLLKMRPYDVCCRCVQLTERVDVLTKNIGSFKVFFEVTFLHFREALNIFPSLKK